MQQKERVIQKTAEATGDLIANKIADKITYLGKTKVKKMKKRDKKSTYHQKKYSKLLIVLTLYKNGIPKNHKNVRYNA